MVKRTFPFYNILTYVHWCCGNPGMITNIFHDFYVFKWNAKKKSWHNDNKDDDDSDSRTSVTMILYWEIEKCNYLVYHNTKSAIFAFKLYYKNHEWDLVIRKGMDTIEYNR